MSTEQKPDEAIAVVSLAPLVSFSSFCCASPFLFFYFCFSSQFSLFSPFAPPRWPDPRRLCLISSSDSDYYYCSLTFGSSLSYLTALFFLSPPSLSLPRSPSLSPMGD